MASPALAEGGAETMETGEVATSSPWQAFHVYLMEKISSVRNFTSRRSTRPGADGSPLFTVVDFEREDERERAELLYLYAGQDVGAAPVFRLPQEMLLNIFSLLSCRDLCACAQVCRLWRKVSEDPLMWSARLVEDSRLWPFCSNHTFIDKELRAKAPAKLAYLRCSPEFGGAAASPSLTRRHGGSVGGPGGGSGGSGGGGGVSSHVSNLWRSWFPRKNPRFLLSEGDPSLRFMRRILHDKFNAFVPVSMFSTEWFLNAGLTYQMDVDGRDFLFDLVTFGSNPRVEAQLFEVVPNPAPPAAASDGAPAAEQQLEAGVGVDEADQPRLRLGDNFRRYVHHIDGLIFIINAEIGEEEFKRRRAEYKAYVESLADRPSVPILFLSLVMEEETKRRHLCVDMARHLGLITLPNPWYICDGRSKGLHRVIDGFLWLVQRTF